MLAAGITEAEMLTHAQNAPAIAFFQQRGYRIHWLSTQYSARLDRDVESIGMIRDLVAPDAAARDMAPSETPQLAGVTTRFGAPPPGTASIRQR